MAIFSVWTYFKSKERRELSWSAQSFQSPYQALTNTILTIKNTGNLDLTRDDLLQSIRFTLNIAPHAVRLITGPAKELNPNGYEVFAHNGELAFAFGYMAKKDTACVEILHSANIMPFIKVVDEPGIRNGKIQDNAIVEKNRTNRFFLRVALAALGLIGAFVVWLLLFMLKVVDFGNVGNWCVFLGCMSITLVSGILIFIFD